MAMIAHCKKTEGKMMPACFFSLSLFWKPVFLPRGEMNESGQSWTRLTVPSAELVCQRVFASFEVAIIGCQTLKLTK